MKLEALSVLDAITEFFATIPESGITDLPSAQIRSFFADNDYATLAQARVTEIIKSNPLLVPIGIDPADELADCDDFALQLKAAVIARARMDNLNAGVYVPPPAIGIVVTMNHALNAFVTLRQGTPTVMLVDASHPDQPITADPVKAVQLLKQLPIRFIYI